MFSISVLFYLISTIQMRLFSGGKYNNNALLLTMTEYSYYHLKHQDKVHALSICPAIPDNLTTPRQSPFATNNFTTHRSVHYQDFCLGGCHKFSKARKKGFEHCFSLCEIQEPYPTINNNREKTPPCPLSLITPRLRSFLDWGKVGCHQFFRARKNTSNIDFS